MKLNEAINKAVKMGKDSHGFRPRSWQGSSANVAPDILVMMLSAQVERYREKKEELERKINAFTINPGTPCN